MNCTAVVTGASRGIGRGVAVELAKVGYDLVLNFARNEIAAQEAVNACLKSAEEAGKRVRVLPFKADISSSADRLRLIDYARSEFSGLNLLVNNAGIAPRVRADVLEASEESFDELIGTNLKGPYFLTQLASRWMVETAEPGGTRRAKIVIVSSISAYTASINRGDYCIAKAGLSMVTALFAARLADHGINVYEIRPGVIATDMTGAVKEKYDKLIDEGLTPIRRWGQPADVGRAVAAIACDLLPFSTGEVINVDGGFHLHRL